MEAFVRTILDPDNRRPVDCERRQALLESVVATSAEQRNAVDVQ